jgi:hypothetical protein
VADQDIRVGAWSVQATSGTERTIVQTWTEDGEPFVLTGRDVSLWVGDLASADVTDFTDADEYEGVVSDGNVVTFTAVPIPVVSTGLRMTLDGEVVTIGRLFVAVTGTGSGQLEVAVNVAPIAVAVSVFGVGVAGGGGGVTSVNGDTGPVVVLVAGEVAATPSEALSGLTVQAQLDQANALFEATDTNLGTLNDDLVQVNADLDTHEALTTTAHGGIVAGTDPRLTNARTPTAHAVSHQDGGSDELAIDASQITAGTIDDARIPAGIARDSEVTAAIAGKVDGLNGTTGLWKGTEAAYALLTPDPDVVYVTTP